MDSCANFAKNIEMKIKTKERSNKKRYQNTCQRLLTISMRINVLFTTPKLLFVFGIRIYNSEYDALDYS